MKYYGSSGIYNIELSIKPKLGIAFSEPIGFKVTLRYFSVQLFIVLAVCRTILRSSGTLLGEDMNIFNVEFIVLSQSL
jgi:hypothetical protein